MKETTLTNGGAHLVSTAIPPLVAVAQAQDGAAGESESIWNKLLDEVYTKSANTSFKDGLVVVDGDSGSGKSCLAWRLTRAHLPDLGGTAWQPTEWPYAPLNYKVMQVQGDGRDGAYAYQLGLGGASVGLSESSQMAMRILQPDEGFRPLIDIALCKPLAKTVLVFCVPITAEASIIHRLRARVALFKEEIRKKFGTETVDEAKQTQARFWQEYVEPITSSMTASVIGGPGLPAVVGAELELAELPELEQGALVENPGAPIIVAVTMGDRVSQLPQAHVDRLLYHLRRFCVAHGAALVVCSAQSGKNIQLVYKYIIHRAFGVPFTQPSQLVERDALFVPAGWDNLAKQEITRASLDPSAAIDPPLVPTPTAGSQAAKKTFGGALNGPGAGGIGDDECDAPEWNDFLLKLAETTATQQLQQGGTASDDSAGEFSTPQSRRILADDGGTDKLGGTPGSASAAAAQASQLTSFFSSLIKNSPAGSPASRATAPGGGTPAQEGQKTPTTTNVPTTDAEREAHLNRLMAQAKQPPPQQQKKK